MKKFSTIIKKADLIAKIPSARLHFGEATSHKTVTGGICTLLAFFAFFFVAIYTGVEIISKKTPYVNS